MQRPGATRGKTAERQKQREGAMSQILTEIDEQLDNVELTALDRCDSCGAQAYVRVTLASGELLFCAHHAAKFKEKLSAQAIDWHDETARLNPQPSSGER